MNIEHLVKMANQIGDFYKSFPNQEEAKSDIAKHMVNFWASSMRKQVLAHVNTQNGEGLTPIVIDAIKQHIK
jgi:formate dehydrogenase subunit delta